MIRPPSIGFIVAACLTAVALAAQQAGVETLLQQGRYEEAYQQAQEVAARAETDPVAWFWLGQSARGSGRDEEAIQAFRKAAARPEFLDAWLGLGAVYEGQENWAKAAESYEKAILVQPGQPLAYARLGDIYRKNGSWANAVEQYSRALERAPGDARLESLLQACRNAVQEQQQGAVSSATFRGIARASAGSAEGLGEAIYRGLKAKPDPEAGADEPARIPVHITFPRDRFSVEDLTESARKQLDEVAATLLSPEWKGRRPVVIEGHACSCGAAAFNVALGRKRAEAVRQYLIAKQAIEPAEATAVSLGKSNPVLVPAREQLPYEACQRDKAHSENRRVIVKEAREGSAARVVFWYRPASNGDFRPLTNGAVLRTNDEVKVQLRAYSKVHAYIFHHGSADDWAVLFPARAGGRANPLFPGRDHWVPTSDSGFVLDETPGTEETLVYLSPGPDPTLEKLVDKMLNELRPRPVKSANRPSVPAKPPGAPPPPAVPPTKKQAREGKDISDVAIPPDPPEPESHAFPNVHDFLTRGLKGVKASKTGDAFLRIRSYASVKFEHQR